MFPQIYGIVSQGALTYSQRVLATAPANLIAYWPLNETSGTVADNAEGTAARDGAYNGVTLNSSTFTNGDPVGLWDGTNDFGNVYSASLNTVLNGQEITVAGWFKVSGAGVWTDGAFRRLFILEVSVAHNISIFKRSDNNQITFIYTAANTTVSVTHGFSQTGWVHYAITASLAADQMKAYLNGAQVGTTQTGLGTWAGALVNTGCVIGARNTTPIQVWDGYLAHPAVWTTPLSAAQILALATV